MVVFSLAGNAEVVDSREHDTLFNIIFKTFKMLMGMIGFCLTLQKYLTQKGKFYVATFVLYQI